MNESMLFSRISFTENKLRRDFKNGKVHILVGTDVAARGIDVSSIGLVVQADSPRDIDTYTHRAGRTGRAGRLYLTFVLQLFLRSYSCLLSHNRSREKRRLYHVIGTQKWSQHRFWHS